MYVEQVLRSCRVEQFLLILSVPLLVCMSAYSRVRACACVWRNENEGGSERKSEYGICICIHL